MLDEVRRCISDARWFKLCRALGLAPASALPAAA
jgi:hypothetical protein